MNNFPENGHTIKSHLTTKHEDYEIFWLVWKFERLQKSDKTIFKQTLLEMFNNIINNMLKLILFPLLILSTLSNDQPTDFDYNNHGSDWSCPKNGTKQSPILLSINGEIQKSKSSHLFGDYFSSVGVANFLNTTIYINTSDSFGSVYTKLVDGNSVPFKANQIRIRMHSEHQTQMGYYDLEVQIFHAQLYTTTRNYRLAIGLLFNESQTPDPFIQQIIDAYDKNNASSPMQVDLSHLLPRNVVDDFWFYQGSGTIPPCSQGRYHWVVSRKTHAISSQQKAKMIKILSRGDESWTGNWRSIQAQNKNVLGFRHVQEIKTQY